MKILFVSLFLPQEKSPHAGGRYVFEILRDLSRRHAITLATRVEDAEQAAIERLRPYCTEIFPYPYKTAPAKRDFLYNIGLVRNYLGFSRFSASLARRGEFDLVQVEWVETALLMARGKAPMVLDAHDVITKPAERAMRQAEGAGKLLAALRYLFVRAAERRIAKRADMIFTRSDFDREYLLALHPGLNTTTVPHPAGLDITERSFERRKGNILFLASYKHRKVNVEAALYFYERVFPKVRAAVPEARFIIAGYGPPVELTSLPEKDAHVLVPGFVDDLDRCYKQAEVFVAPILVGGGIIVKILDAMAAGTPVVTTSYGNEGIGAVLGRDLLVADDPERFAEAVVTILRDPEHAGCLAENARMFVRRNFSLESVIDRIEDAYRDIVQSGPD
jgi:glycosyltransferase involved in cell wall biosynthesis